MSETYRSTPIWRHAMAGISQTVSEFPGWLKLSHEIQPGAKVPADFFGINVATNQDPACDDYVIAALQDLGLKQVRLGYSYDAVNGPAARLLNRLLSEGYEVLLDLLPDPQDAKRLAQDDQAQARWKDFLTQTFANYGNRVSAFEVGNTPNRGRWSGHDAPGYLATWMIAATAAQSAQVQLAGPNISDFEPIYSVGFLSAMQAEHSVPAVQTDNLFVERVIQPEAYDHRVAGRFATNTLKLNLVKKARVLTQIGLARGIEQTWCTYTCWTRKRLARWSIDPEQKNADYLMRYLIAVAASGDLSRVYWGPLLCQRDGLIACGNHQYPKVDNVSYYREVRGNVVDFQKSPAFHALGFCVRMLSDATCTAAHNNTQGLHYYRFNSPSQGDWDVVWCMDRKQYAVSELYDVDTLAKARLYSPTGELLQQLPDSINEHPLVLHWDIKVAPRNAAQLQQTASSALEQVVFWPKTEWHTQVLQTSAWRGVLLLPPANQQQSPSADQIPQLLTQLPETKVLRDKRNRLWNIKASWWSEGEQTVKLNRAKGLKRFSYKFLPSKGKRHWNNATELLRLGVNTPQPLGFFEQPSSNAHDSYYICQFIEDAFSCRNLFTAFAQGDTEYQGIAKDQWLQEVAKFVARMHRFGVIHQDLSSGNLMMTCTSDSIEFFLIDIGRAKIDANLASQPRWRFKDLNRICYKLNWTDREALMQAYAEHSSRPLPSWWRLSLSSYDWKQNSKKFLKRRKAPSKSKALS